MRKRFEFEFNLNNENIDTASAKVAAYFADTKADRKEVTRLRLSMENVLLFWQEELGEAAAVKLEIRRRFGNIEVQLYCAGREANPFPKDKDETGDWISSLRSSLESKPVFDYLNKTNTVIFAIKRKRVNRLVQVLFFLALGVLIGFAGALIPADIRFSVCEKIITPFYNSYLSLVSLCGIPLIFLSMITGILGVGNLHTFTKIGKGMVLRFALIILAVTALTVVVAFFMFPLEFSQNGVSFEYGDFIAMIFGWVPSGVFQPFIDSNAIQLIIIGALIAIAILALDGCSGTMTNFFNDANSVLLKIFSWLTTLIPFFVCVMIVNSMWGSEMEAILSAWKSWVLTTGGQLLFTLLLLVAIAFRCKVKIAVLVKKMYKTFFIALGTNSCTASIPENYACCAKMGIDGKIFVFGIPIGTTCFKPATAIRLVFLCFFMANLQQVSISVGWLILLFILCVVFSVAIPAIPGGVIMFCAMLFTQLSIPTEVVAQMLATDVFFDCVCTAFNQVSVELVLVDHAKSIGYLDEEMLRD